MGKAKKVKVSKGETKEPKIGLADQIELEKEVKVKNRQKIRRRADEEEVSFSIYFIYCICLLHSVFLNQIEIIKFFEKHKEINKFKIHKTTGNLKVMALDCIIKIFFIFYFNCNLCCFYFFFK